MSRLVLCATLALLGASLRLEAKDDDEELNQAYGEAVKAMKGNAERKGELKSVQQAWIAYRDAQADFEAWFQGGKAPREEAMEHLTMARTDELRHIAKNGVSRDLPAAADETAAGDEATVYADLRGRITASHNAEWIVGYIKAEQAWNTFADRQSAFDGSAGGAKHEQDESDKREQIAASLLKRSRAGLLKRMSEWGGFPPAVAAGAKEEEQPADDSTTCFSPRKNFRIEQISSAKGEDDEGRVEIWVVSNETSKRVRLPEVQIRSDETSGDIGFPSSFSFSPDEHWIFRTQKIVSGVGAGYLYERKAPDALEFNPVGKGRWDSMAWRFFAKTAGYKASEDELAEMGVIRAEAWRNGKLRINLSAKELSDGKQVGGWRADYDLAKKSFEVPPELQASNRAAIHTRERNRED